MKTTSTNLITVIEFARRVDKRPQQIYGAIRNGSFPQELVTYVANASGHQQPMILNDEAYTWVTTRDAARAAKLLKSNSVETVVEEPKYTIDQLLIDLAAGGKKGLATQISKFLEAKVAPVVEETSETVEA